MFYVDKSIVDVCFPLFNIIFNLKKNDVTLDFYVFQSIVLKSFFSVEEDMKRLGISGSVSDDVKFVMSAFLDEMILKREGELSRSWSKESLQAIFFKESLGGEKFFDRLSYLMKFSDKRVDLLELYYWCLELGYEGKYAQNNANDLNLIKQNLAAVIKLHYLEKYKAVDCQEKEKVNCRTGLTSRFRKMSLTYLGVALLFGCAMVYGIQILVTDYLLCQLKML